MKLYQYEFNSDEDDKRTTAGKKLVGEFTSPNDVLDYIRRIRFPNLASIKTEHPLEQYKRFAIIACNRDETLWLLDYEDNHVA